jgi:hypothetical protein
VGIVGPTAVFWGIEKPAFGPVVRFDCCVFYRSGNEGGGSSDFDVRGA